MNRLTNLPSLTGLLALAAGSTVAQAQTPAPTSAPTTPVYTSTFNDAVTADNALVVAGTRFYSVDAGADSYQNDIYERPIAQGFNLVGTQYVASEYFAYIDITQAKFGFDNRFIYVAIDLAGLDKRTADGVNTIEGLQARYGFRFGLNADGRNSYYIQVDQPQQASLPNTLWTLQKTEAYRDTDQDVGGRGGPIHGNPGPSGLTVTKVANILEEQGLNGWDQQVIQSDGLTTIGLFPALWQRVSPTDNTVVEIALDYTRLGLTRANIESIAYLHFEAQTGDLANPGYGLWNDQFTGIEAGSPNLGIGTDNEFGTQGLGAISGVDSLRGTLTIAPPPPPPACLADIAGANQSTVPDGVLTSDDVIRFIGWYFGNDTRADIAGINQSSTPDGQLTADDIIRFITLYFAGC
ncbi:MAG: hypothetical protein MUE97_04735 [Phycisphaerales bacterium]|nr:hypothetical protein [Phycisphaerales bacterium]